MSHQEISSENNQVSSEIYKQLEQEVNKLDKIESWIERVDK